MPTFLTRRGAARLGAVLLFAAACAGVTGAADPSTTVEYQGRNFSECVGVLISYV